MGTTAQSNATAKGSRIEITRMLGNAHQGGHLGGRKPKTVLQQIGQLTAIEDLGRGQKREQQANHWPPQHLDLF